MKRACIFSSCGRSVPTSLLAEDEKGVVRIQTPGGRQNAKTVRVVEIDGDPWFIAADVCKALDIGNVSKALTNLTSSDVSHARLSPTGRARPNKIVSEGGLYELVFQSRKPAAREFTRWVAGTVIPSIRKNGGYIAGQEKVATGEMSLTSPIMRLKISDFSYRTAQGREQFPTGGQGDKDFGAWKVASQLRHQSVTKQQPPCGPQRTPKPSARPRRPQDYHCKS